MKSKAIFLLVIFLLHTVVGFGCALGMEENHDNDNHSHTKAAVHEHKDHQHNHAKDHEITSIPGLNSSKEDTCCKKLVNELTIQNKLIPESAKVLVSLPVVGLANYAYTLLVPVISIEPDQSGYVDHRCRPPNEDIRISIQSFQI